MAPHYSKLVQERVRNNFPIWGSIVSEGSLGLTPEGSRSVARGILPLEGIRRRPPPPDGAWREGFFGLRSRGGGTLAMNLRPLGADAGHDHFQTKRLFPSRFHRMLWMRA